MSKYTTEVRFICEFNAGLDESVGYNDVDNVIDESYDKIFDFNFPIFDELYRSALEKKILKHFYTREIAYETVGLWKLKLATKMNEIMPYYNKLYLSELIEFNPLYTKNIRKDGHKENEEEYSKSGTKTETKNKNNTEGGSNTRNENGVNWDMYSDTPQGSIANMEWLDDRSAYLTNARKLTDNSNRTDTFGKTNSEVTTGGHTTTDGGNRSGNGDYWETISGYENKNPSKSIMEYRKTFLNIDMMIIEELEDLFFQLW